MLSGYATLSIDGNEISALYINGELVYSNDSSESSAQNEG